MKLGEADYIIGCARALFGTAFEKFANLSQIPAEEGRGFSPSGRRLSVRRPRLLIITPCSVVDCKDFSARTFHSRSLNIQCPENPIIYASYQTMWHPLHPAVGGGGSRLESRRAAPTNGPL
jgi:hypothetical protein